MKKRFLFNNLLQSLNNNKVTVIVGPRQIGKTTLLKQLYNYINQKGDICYYFI